MKKTLFILFSLTFTVISYAQVAISASSITPNAHAMLEVVAVDKGVLIPRLTAADRTNMVLTSTEDGLTVYDTDSKSFWYWNGTDWSEMATDNIVDADWFKEGTTDAPSDITDKMFHEGDVAIGKNVANAKLDVSDSINTTTLIVNNINTDNTVSLRTAGHFNVNGVASTSNGITGVYASVGGDPGSGYKPLIGFETDMVAQAGVNPYQYAYLSDLSGASDKSFVGNYNYLHDTGGAGARYGVLNNIGGESSGIIYSVYTTISNTGDGIHFGNYYRIGGAGNGVQYGAFNRILNTGSGKQIGVVNEINNAGEAIHIGTMNSIGAGVTEDNPAVLVPITNDTNGKRVGNVNVVAGNGGGQHAALLNTVISTGDGVHLGTGNVLGYDYVSQTSTTTSGTHIGISNNLNDLGNGVHTGALNVLGAVLDTDNPNIMTPVSGDSNADRLGIVNTIAGDGGGKHTASINTVISTGDGEHIASYNSVSKDGNGAHIAVYGEVDATDNQALAGAFKGYTTAVNQVSTINLYSGLDYEVNNASFADLNLMEAGFDPRLYNQLGLLQVKVIVRVSSASGSDNKFQLHAKNSSGDVYPVVDTDTWTWTETDTTAHKYVISSEWKTWPAGLNPWELHLQAKSDDNMHIVNVYIVVRPVQL